jgi:PAS domain S-box-containing protein
MPCLNKSGQKVYADITIKKGHINDISVNIIVYKDVTEELKSEQAVQENESKYTAIFGNSKDAVMTLEPPSWKFTDCNNATLKLFGCKTNEEFLKMGPWDFSPKHQLDGSKSSDKAGEMISKAMNEGTAHFEWLHCDKKGIEFPANVFLTRLEIDGSPVIQATVRDESLQLSIEALEHEKQEAIKANRAKSNFLATMSHEIRTPMNGILGYAQILMDDEELGGEHKTLVKRILSLGDSLTHIIGDILDLSAIESGQSQVGHSSFRPLDMFTSIIEIFSTSCQEKGLELNFNYSNDVPELIESDQMKIKQVVMNLLENSVKYTGKGSIELNVGYDLKHDRILVSVIDTGYGIKEEHQKTIFEAFSRGDRNVSIKHSGTGLGLAIVAKIVELLNGEITLKSEFKCGSAFTVSIPVELTYSHRNMTNTHAPVAKGNEIQSILVVEDDEDSMNIIKYFLKSLNYKIDLAHDGIEATEKALENNYDIILMDISMPRRDGFEACNIIRENQSIEKRSIIIALTAFSTDEDKQACLESGMDDYISKPINKKKLLAVLSRYE